MTKMGRPSVLLICLAWRRGSRVKRTERLVHQPVNFDALAQGPLPVAQRALPRNANLARLRLTWGSLEALDKLAEPLLEVIGLGQQIGLEHDKQVSVVPIGVDRR